MHAVSEQLSRIASGLSGEALQSLESIGTEQERLRKQKEAEEYRQHRKLEWRIQKAKAGLERLRAFGKDPELQKVIRARDTLAGTEDGLMFYQACWTWIGEGPKTFLSFSFQHDGLLVSGIDYCWAVRHKTWSIPYGADEVVYRQYYSHPHGPPDTLPLSQLLKEISGGMQVSLSDLLNRKLAISTEEEDVFAELLIRWSRERVFNGLVGDFLSELEGKLKHAK